jgi:putative ABC transport system permease protein
MNHQFNLKEILRWASHNKSTTALSISGMAIGIAVAMLIGIWSLNEFSFDKYHKDSKRIYRIYFQGFINGESVRAGTVFGAAGTAAKEQLPDVEDMTRIMPFGRNMLKIKGKNNYEDQICYVDKNLFNFFSFKLETGSRQTCLDGPDKMVIDQYLANKYFASENPIGQIIEYYDKKFQISAVMENVPENSHLKFHIVMPIEGDKWLNENQNKWGTGASFMTYLKLKEGTNTATLAGQITEIADSGFPVYKQFGIRHFLQPLTEIHLSSGFGDRYVNFTDGRIVFIFISIAALILLIACFNFINLFISTSFQRAKSIGIKKISGSSKAGLFAASYLETAMYITVGTLLAIIIVIVSLPYFNQLAGSNLKIDFSNYQIYIYSAILVLSTMAIAGTIPVLYILRFNPEEIIRSRFKGKGVTMLQRVLVVSQFAASIVLISSAIIIEKQINYVQNKDLGFNNKQLICFSPRNMAKNFETTREELMKNPAIADVTAKTCLPNEWYGGLNVKLKDSPGNEIILEVCPILYNYPGVMEIPVIEGRNPFKRGENHSKECMINEQAIHGLGINGPISKELYVGDSLYTIAGVLKNANTKSLHQLVGPQVYVSLKELSPFDVMMVKTTRNKKGAIEALSAAWNKSNPDVPFEYNFLDETYHRLYKLEETASKIILIGMIIALFLAFMGLYAISHYAIERRTKEIGIRKVNGAKVSEVMAMLNKDFIKWVVISFVVATPIAWYVMHRWLENFAYKISLSWWIFVLAGLMALGISLLTISWRSWKAATRNPVEALRYE